MEILLIFAGLVMPLLLALPFFRNRRVNKKDLEAQNIIDRLKGINRNHVDWPGPP